ncbi:MAG: glycoside hydrolase family 71/99-like protein, partial [Planctomycetota bacterium]
AKASGLSGHIFCGYQGWFNCEGDGANLGWRHYEKQGRFEPGHCTIDYWPDVSELEADEKFATAFKHADGSTAYVFSPYLAKTVRRHFRWMREYGIDGVFVQRFATSATSSRTGPAVDQVLQNCRAAAEAEQRSFVVMYDLSGLQPGRIERVIDDWKRLCDKMQITSSTAYLRHEGKPLVAAWGLGFRDRKVPPKEWDRLVKFLQHDPKYGGCAVMLGVPTGWQSLSRDCIEDPMVLKVIEQADVVSPWTVGRYGGPAAIRKHATQFWQADMAWCQNRGIEYLPVVFPGFSWHNMKPEDPLDHIPRRKGEFFWNQCTEAKRVGADSLYVAMFDEIDEGTAIFKCTNDPPVGESPFLTYEGLPTDWYLRIAGQARRLLRGEIPTTAPLQQVMEAKQ